MCGRISQTPMKKTIKNLGFVIFGIAGSVVWKIQKTGFGLCLIGKHKWKECRCARCNKIRDEMHNWIGGKCGYCQTLWSKEEALKARQRVVPGQSNFTSTDRTYFYDIDDSAPG